MFPELFRIGDFVISSFGLMMVLAFVAAYLQLRSGLRRLGIGGEEDASAIVFTAGVAGIAGSKIYYAILYGDWRLLFDRSGLVWYGGFLLTVVALWWVLRRRGLPVARTMDAGGVALAVGYAVGRVGCFLVGDDYGLPTELPWGVEFPRGLPPTYAANLRELGAEVPAHIPGDTLLAVHPTQLYETFLALLVWLAARAYLKRRPPAGTTVALVVALLAAERFAVEFVRAKDDRFFGTLTLAQVLSVAVFLAAAALFLRWQRGTPAEA